MKMQKRRSLATTLRLSLLTGASALGWMALGTSGATAADLPASSGLLGSVSDVVDSATAPLQSRTSSPSSGAAAHSGISGLVPQVTEIVAAPLGTLLPEIDTAANELITHLPVVGAIVPPVAVTPVVSPIIAPVDAIVGGVTAPVLGVVEPVVLEPVVGVLEPVVDVVVPVVPPIVDAAPIPVIPSPVAPVLPPAGVVDAVVPATPGPVAPTPVPDGGQATDGYGEAPTSFASETSAAAQSPTATDPVLLSTHEGLLETMTATVRAEAQTGVERVVDVVVLPVLMASIDATSIASDLSLGSLAASGAASSMTGAGSAGPLAALGAASIFFVLLISGRARRDAAPGLPSAPCFDPGSSPD